MARASREAAECESPARKCRGKSQSRENERALPDWNCNSPPQRLFIDLEALGGALGGERRRPGAQPWLPFSPKISVTLFDR